MPIVTVYWFSERTHEMRQKVAEGITEVISNVTNAPKDIVRVLFVDVPTTHWSKGGTLVSDYKEPPKYLQAQKK
jgi:4-oxalocrotonate tautomerase family enzyme